MRAIMVMFDSLNRRFLGPYDREGRENTCTPGFDRLAKHAVTFDNCYIGSMPCMPARRELHTGRYNMLHRSWGPLEPFDDSMPAMLSRAGIYTHLISDHQHYWEDGGATFHHRYDSWEIVRGQEGDRWKADVRMYRACRDQTPNRLAWNDSVNRTYMDCEKKQPQTQVFDLGLEFLQKNQDEDGWFLQIESFDPHEPFYVMDQYKRLYPDAGDGKCTDWPPYAPVTEDDVTCRHLRNQYKALLAMCDHSLSRVLDFMDSNDMWKDTMLIVNTDHGYLLGEHGWWAKMLMPHYNEIAHTPLFIWDPASGISGERRSALVQGIDLPLTLLDAFGVSPGKDMLGKSLRGAIANDTPVHDAVLFGMHGLQLNVTDGRYVYMRAPVNDTAACFDYTLMPTHMRSLFTVEEMHTARMAPPFTFTKDCPVMKIRVPRTLAENRLREDPLAASVPDDSPYGEIRRDWLFDLQTDPGQMRPLHDEAVKNRMLALMTRLVEENDAPQELYAYYGLDRAST